MHFFLKYGRAPLEYKGTLPKGDQNLEIKTQPFTDFLIYYNNLKHGQLVKPMDIFYC